MNVAQLELLAELRAAVGFLGEREQHGWWPSSFFSSGSRAFLSPVFARTSTLAQCSGVTRAAALIHDNHIGIGRVFHLFRLPEDVEQGIHQALHQPQVVKHIATITAGREAALQHLQSIARTTSSVGVGPIRMGDSASLRETHRWRLVAAHYVRAFTAGEDVFPFFANSL